MEKVNGLLKKVRNSLFLVLSFQGELRLSQTGLDTPVIGCLCHSVHPQRALLTEKPHPGQYTHKHTHSPLQSTDTISVRAERQRWERQQDLKSKKEEMSKVAVAYL